ncbi:hypothetical protein [Haloarcula sp. JP-L23]|nr:hypothetical protein G9465_12515 [Haloarcula sp. JP-L23]
MPRVHWAYRGDDAPAQQVYHDGSDREVSRLLDVRRIRHDNLVSCDRFRE